MSAAHEGHAGGAKETTERRPDQLQIISMTMKDGEELTVGRRLRDILIQARTKGEGMNRLILALMVLTVAVVGAEQKAVVPAGGPAPVGPYSPGVIADGYLYVSGQGAKAADGQMPSTFDAQAQQTLENVKGVVEAAGLTLDHVVYTHVYLEDINNAAALDRVYARYFQKDPPARALIGVARLPGTPVEINAVARRQIARVGRRFVCQGGMLVSRSHPGY